MFDPIGRALRIDQGDSGGVAGFGFVQPLLAQYLPVGQMRVVRDLADPQMVIAQDLAASPILGPVMFRLRAPAHQRLLVAPGREREQPALTRETPVTDVVDESVDPLYLGPEHLCDTEISLPMLRPGLNFEQNCEHLGT